MIILKILETISNSLVLCTLNCTGIHSRVVSMKRTIHITSFKSISKRLTSNLFHGLSMTLCVNKRDWYILEGNEKRNVRDCLDWYFM